MLIKVPGECKHATVLTETRQTGLSLFYAKDIGISLIVSLPDLVVVARTRSGETQLRLSVPSIHEQKFIAAQQNLGKLFPGLELFNDGPDEVRF